jgi:hypothetical protein
MKTNKKAWVSPSMSAVSVDNTPINVGADFGIFGTIS